VDGSKVGNGPEFSMICGESDMCFPACRDAASALALLEQSETPFIENEYVFLNNYRV
jgi:hypothetical protein